MKKKPSVKVTEQGNKIILIFDPILAQKSVRNFEPPNSTPKVHKTNKGKGSYTRKEKHKEKDGDDENRRLFFMRLIGNFR